MKVLRIYFGAPGSIPGIIKRNVCSARIKIGLASYKPIMLPIVLFFWGQFVS